MKTHIIRHFLVHTRKKLFICEVWNKGVSEKSQLTYYSCIYISETSFSCWMGNKKFSQKSALKMHFFLCTYEKSFICEEWNKVFSQKCTLNRHNHVHYNNNNNKKYFLNFSEIIYQKWYSMFEKSQVCKIIF